MTLRSGHLLLIVAGGGLAVLAAAFWARGRGSAPPPPARAPSVATPASPEPAPPTNVPPGPKPPAPAPADPLREWQMAIRRQDKTGVLGAQSLFLAREDDYREPLMKMAREDPEPRNRAFSVAVVGRMRKPPPEEFFIEKLADAQEFPRTSALQALERLGTSACLPKVDGLAASDPVESVRAAAAQAAKAVRSR